MSIEEEIARAMRYAIRPDVPVHLPVPRMYEDMTAALAPILNRVRAEAASTERKKIAAMLQQQGDRMDGEGTQAGYYAAAYLVRERERDRIEQNSEGNEA